jgi:hypothetical protein
MPAISIPSLPSNAPEVTTDLSAGSVHTGAGGQSDSEETGSVSTGLEGSIFPESTIATSMNTIPTGSVTAETMNGPIFQFVSRDLATAPTAPTPTHVIVTSDGEVTEIPILATETAMGLPPDWPGQKFTLHSTEEADATPSAGGKSLAGQLFTGQNPYPMPQHSKWLDSAGQEWMVVAGVFCLCAIGHPLYRCLKGALVRASRVRGENQAADRLPLHKKE